MNSLNGSIVMVPIDRIQVINPRARDKKRFAEIVQNIAAIGLKRPITVRELAGDESGPRYELICGQGRLEAYTTLGQTTIPALIRKCDRKEALLASLVENIARRRIRAVEQIRSIGWMHDQGHDAAGIAAKTGFAEAYIKGILRLLKHGEMRLLDAALHGRIPITIAMQIAQTSDEEAQKILMAAYDSGEIKQKTLANFRKVIQHRRDWGKNYPNDRMGRERKPSSEVFISRYRQLANRQKLMIKKARICEARLLALAVAFQTLTSDEDFTNLLRAEELGTLPKFLAERVKKVS